MASLETCILSAQQQGAITPEDAADLIRRYNAFLGAFRQTMGEGEAARQAKAMLVERLDAEGLQRKRAALLQLEAGEIIKQRLLSNVNARGEADPAQALTYLVEYFGELERGGGTSVIGRGRAIAFLAASQMEEALKTFQSSFLGRRLNKAKLQNVVREAFGEDTGDPAAKALAASWSAVAEDLRQRYNQHGGMIGELDKWGLPQRHDARAIRAAGYPAWRDFLIDTLDFRRIRDHLTGRPMSREQMEESLKHVYDSITTEGWAHRDPSFAAGGKGALFKQHAESRFLIFKNADAWMAYQDRFGEGDAFAAMMGHVKVMARDIGAMQVLGPNPAAGLEYAKQIVMKEAQAARAGDPAVFATKTEWLGRSIKNPVEYAQTAIHRAEQMWDYARGATNAPVSATVADVMATRRNQVSAASLGSAILSAPSDLGFQTMARRFAGLPVTNLLSSIVANFRGASRAELQRAALNLDSALHQVGDQARMSNAAAGRAWSAVLADRYLAAQGLTAFTDAEKAAFGRTFMGAFADHAHLGRHELPPALIRTLDRYGIDDDLWNVIRAARKYEMQHGGQAHILRPAEIMAQDPFLVELTLRHNVALQDYMARAIPALERDTPEAQGRAMARAAAERYLEMILAETEYAVPSGTVRSRTWMIGDTAPGTAPGELLRSSAQFKSFGMSVWQLQIGRMAREIAAGRTSSGLAQGAAVGARYGFALLFYTTMLGALSAQIKSLTQGKDPRPMNDPKFWAAAMLQGGGMGLYGDFFFSDVNRMGGSFAGSLAGPLAGRLNNVWQLTGGNVVQFANEEKSNFGRELTQFVRQNTPGSSLWYLRLAWERVAMDNLQRLLDPKADEAFRRRRQQVAKDQRTDYWFGPGQRAGDARAVDWGNAWKAAR